LAYIFICLVCQQFNYVILYVEYYYHAYLFEFYVLVSDGKTNLVHIMWHLYGAHAIFMTKIVQDC